MAIKRFRGDAPAVAQVNTLTPSGVSAGRTFDLVINGKTIAVIAANSTLSLLTSAMAEAVAASTIPEFGELTATDITTGLQLSAKTPGKPFTQTSTAFGGGTLSTAAAAGQGPNDLAIGQNFTSLGLPTAGDTLLMEQSAADLSWSLDALNGTTLGLLSLDASYTGAAGLPDYNGGSTLGYYEYRPKYFQVCANVVNIGQGDGSGSGRIRLDLGANDTTINIYRTGQAIDTGLPAVIIKGSGSPYTLTITQGSAGFALFEGEVCNLPLVRIGSDSSPATDVQLTFGAGSTLGLIQQNGGEVSSGVGIGTLQLRQGELTLWYGSINTMNLTPATGESATLFWRSAGTLGPTVIGAGGVLDCSANPMPRVAYNVRVRKGAKIYDPYGTVTWTGGILLDGCGLADVDIDIGGNFTLSKS